MPKKKIICLAIFSIIVFCSIINFLPIVHAINYTTSDAEDDVLRDTATEEITGDFYDELDIVKLVVAGRNINFTVAGNLANWNSSYSGTIYFSQGFSVSASNQIVWRSPYYTIEFENQSGGGPIEVILKKGYPLDINNHAYEEWNGTGWENQTTATPANIVVDVTEHSVIAYIPDAVEEIPTDMKVVGYTRMSIFIPEYTIFSDVTPVPSTAAGGIPSYNLFILICTMIGVSLIIIKKYKK